MSSGAWGPTRNESDADRLGRYPSESGHFGQATEVSTRVPMVDISILTSRSQLYTGMTRMFPPQAFVNPTQAVTVATGNMPFEFADPAALVLPVPSHGSSCGNSILQCLRSSRASSVQTRSHGIGPKKSTGKRKAVPAPQNVLTKADKANVSRAADILIREIICRIGWEENSDEYPKEYLSEACAESGHRSFILSLIRARTDIRLLFLFFRYHLYPLHTEKG